MEIKNIHPTWLNYIQHEFNKPYFKIIASTIMADEANNNIIYPAQSNIFKAFNLTPFNEIKVVIIGQDPYHGEGEANGLCFSVNENIKIPPSLRNIYKELSTDIAGFQTPNNGNLEKWAKQGILLLNSSLTVIKDQANSHSKIGWHTFTNKIIETISNHKEQIVFILWGKNAHDKMQYINPNKHLVLMAAHPSPLSASRGFLGCKHFSKANDYLIKYNKAPINWYL